jgi:hypothetical protein
MTTLTSATNTQNDRANFAQYDGQFDATVGLPPANTQLGSKYFTAYIAAVNTTGVTPF